tara:strand:- start:1625 stop:1966 length:342 start_codon:yes stop_codon:yes gene_type:complete
MDELITEYEKLYGKKPTGRWGKDQDWLMQKIADRRGLEEFKAADTQKGDDELVITTTTAKPGDKPVVLERGVAFIMLKNQLIREYSSEKHGKGYKKLAEQFAGQYPNYRIELG